MHDGPEVRSEYTVVHATCGGYIAATVENGKACTVI